MHLLRPIFPWIFAAALLFILFDRYPLEDVLAAAGRVDILMFGIFVTAYFSYFCFTDSWSLKKTLSYFGVDGSVSKILKLRLASNLAMILNYGIGQGVLAYLIKRHYQASLSRASGILIFQILVDLYLAITIAFLGSLFTSVVINNLNLAPWIQVVWAVATLIFLLISRFTRKPESLQNIKWRPLENLFETFHGSGIKDYLKLMAWRVPFHVAASTYFFFLAFCFGVHIPLDKVVTLLPIAVAIGAIPITPSGIGTVQITEIYLFQNFITGSAIDRGEVSPADIIFAMSIMFLIGIYILKLLTGMVFYKHAMTVGLHVPDRVD